MSLDDVTLHLHPTGFLQELGTMLKTEATLGKPSVEERERDAVVWVTWPVLAGKEALGQYTAEFARHNDSLLYWLSGLTYVGMHPVAPNNGMIVVSTHDYGWHNEFPGLDPTSRFYAHPFIGNQMDDNDFTRLFKVTYNRQELGIGVAGGEHGQ